jgi:hypothetical protein
VHRASALRDRVRGGGAAQIRHRQRGPLRASRGCAGRPRVFRRVSNLKTSDDHMEMHEEAEAGVNDDGGKEDVPHGKKIWCSTAANQSVCSPSQKGG